jgi:hypothetical protein
MISSKKSIHILGLQKSILDHECIISKKNIMYLVSQSSWKSKTND